MAENRQATGEQGTLGLYLRELRKIPRLSAEEEQACAMLAAQGDPKARQRLIQANLRFVILVARQYRNRGVPWKTSSTRATSGSSGRQNGSTGRGIHFVSYAVCGSARRS
jgi:RNA polymerase primary sigma factor